MPLLFVRQKQVINQIVRVYQQLYMLSNKQLKQYKRQLRIFWVMLDLQEHIAVSLPKPDEVES
ncbi:MAG: FUSC family membrane protein [Sodalis sp. (in: enterobacteria)]